MLRRCTLAAAVALGALMGAGPSAAVAHPLLETAAPSAGLVTPKAPGAVRIALSEPVAVRGSSISITGPRGQAVKTSKLTGSADGRQLSVTPAEPLRSAVYEVRWSILGDDGHRVGGTFGFGVAGAGGAPPPGAETLGGAAAGGRGGEELEPESIVDVLAGWLGILAASALLGGAALVAALRRRGGTDGGALAEAAAGRFGPLAPLAWLLVALAASEGVLAGATAGTEGSLDLALLTDSATGRAELVRGVVVVAFSVAAALLARRRGTVFAAGGAAVLLTYALSGHALVGVGALELVAQGAHVLTAGLWLGGLVALLALARDRAVPLRDATRAYAPVATGALAVAVGTGVLAAVREVDRWELLRWSDYGRVVLVKAALVALVIALGVVAARRAQVRLLRVEAAGVLAVVALAAVLGGLSQGRGRPLPAQEGTLVPGAAYASALLPDGKRPIALVPARSGTNTLTLSGDAPDRGASVRLQRAGTDQVVRATLKPGDGVWSAKVDLPDDGQWFAYTTVDGKAAASPVALSVGVPKTPGAPPETLLVAAEQDGPAAARCRAHAIGLQLAAGRVNAEGGVRDGRKLAPRVVDPADVPALLRDEDARPVAAAVCGDGVTGTARALAKAGVPVLAGDPAVEPVREAGIHRLAADPYAQGIGLAQYVEQRIVPASAPGVRTIAAAVTQDALGRRLLAGLRDGLRGTGFTVVPREPGTLGRGGVAGTKRALDRERIAALVLDQPGDGGADVDALVAVGRGDRDFPPAPVLASSRVLSEALVQRLGTLGRIGVLQGVTEVATQTADALAYVRAVPGLWPGERPSLAGLRGYVTGLAVRSAVGGEDDVSAAAVLRRLRTPEVFSDALLTPWEPRRTGAGTRAVVTLAPQFLASTITPPSAGGMSYTGSWFPDGAWINASVRPLGPTGPTPPL